MWFGIHHWGNGYASEKMKLFPKKTSAWGVFPQQNHTLCSPTRVENHEAVGHSVAYANMDQKSGFGS